MTRPFQTIGLLAKPGDPKVASTLSALREALPQHGCNLILDKTAAAYFDSPDAAAVSRESLAAQCDLVIVVGGDGSMLSASRSLVDAGVAVLGVNLGRLGFLADVYPDEMHERLAEICAGQYREEQRTLLRSEVIRNAETVFESDALNDVVIHKWDIARMIELDTHIDGRYLNSLRADALIVSTPTGSTAYALSGGGPIIAPTLGALVLVPICPHTLSNRPVVVSDQVCIDIQVHGGDADQAQITCDGQVNFSLLAGDTIRIVRKSKTLRLIHPDQHDHFNVMRKKLRWSEQP